MMYELITEVVMPFIDKRNRPLLSAHTLMQIKVEKDASASCTSSRGRAQARARARA